jgi:TetR/AcrR family transcriptional repressor of nem operon
MRYDSEHKERTRQRVLSEAAAAIRAVGPDGIGVAGVMAKAGLTHGAFYAHFESKEDLVAQAISQMFDESRQRFLVRTEHADPAVAMGQFIDYYLSTRHRDAPERGCPLPSLAGELARLPSVAKLRFAAGLERLTAGMARRIEEMKLPDADRLAGSMIAEMVGALALSRAVDSRAESDRILANSRASVRSRIGL